MAARSVTVMTGKDQQVRRVVEGLGAGLLTCGVTAVSSRKLRFELSFDRVWRSWTPSTEFPSVSKHPGEFLWRGIGKSARRLGPIIVWDQGRWSVPRQVPAHWTPRKCLESLSDERASVDDWLELAEAFASRLGGTVSGAAPTAGPDEHCGPRSISSAVWASAESGPRFSCRQPAS